MKISSWTRHDHNTMPPASKTTGNYVNSSLAKVEALKAGYDEAIMLAPNGLVAECTGENIFVSRNGIMLTPPLSAGALEGITQSSVMTIARDLGFDVPRRQPRPQRPVHRRRDLRLRHRRRDQLGQLGRRPPDPVPRPEDAWRSPRSTPAPCAARSRSTRTGASSPSEPAASGPVGHESARRAGLGTDRTGDGGGKANRPGALRPEPLRRPGQLKVGRTIHRWSTCRR